MSGYLSLIEFVPGTKAKAQEVNANFQAISQGLCEKADKAGNSSQVFSVSSATSPTHAINKSQLDILSTDLNAKINAASARFCVKSANVTNGVGDLLGYSGMNVSFKVGGSYPSLVISNSRGTFSTFTSIGTLSMSGKPNGVHNIFIATVGSIYSLANNIYRQPSRPTLVEGDIWLNTGVEPLKAIKYISGSEVEFLDVPLGKVTISGGIISAVETFPYNQNDYEVNLNSTIKPASGLSKSIASLVMPDYLNPVSKAWNTIHQTVSDGYLYVYANISDGYNAYLEYSFNSDLSSPITVWISWMNTPDRSMGASGFVPVPKGMYYKARGGNAGQSLKFYSAKGA